MILPVTCTLMERYDIICNIQTNGALWYYLQHSWQGSTGIAFYFLPGMWVDTILIVFVLHFHDGRHVFGDRQQWLVGRSQICHDVGMFFLEGKTSECEKQPEYHETILSQLIQKVTIIVDRQTNETVSIIFWEVCSSDTYSNLSVCMCMYLV